MTQQRRYSTHLARYVPPKLRDRQTAAIIREAAKALRRLLYIKRLLKSPMPADQFEYLLNRRRHYIVMLIHHVDEWRTTCRSVIPANFFGRPFPLIDFERERLKALRDEERLDAEARAANNSADIQGTD
jgi:hypothetical protein